MCSLRHLSQAPSPLKRHLSVFFEIVSTIPKPLCNTFKKAAGTARRCDPELCLGTAPFSCFIFDPTSTVLKKFGNPGSGRFPWVTLFVLRKKHWGIFHIPYFGILFVTLFQSRNTLSTAEGSLPAAVFGGGRARPAYRLYPALFSTHRKFAKMPRQFPCRGILFAHWCHCSGFRRKSDTGLSRAL